MAQSLGVTQFTLQRTNSTGCARVTSGNFVNTSEFPNSVIGERCSRIFQWLDEIEYDHDHSAMAACSPTTLEQPTPEHGDDDDEKEEEVRDAQPRETHEDVLVSAETSESTKACVVEPPHFNPGVGGDLNSGSSPDIPNHDYPKAPSNMATAPPPPLPPTTPTTLERVLAKLRNDDSFCISHESSFNFGASKALPSSSSHQMLESRDTSFRSDQMKSPTERVNDVSAENLFSLVYVPMLCPYSPRA